MEVRVGLVVLLCLIGFSCAVPVKFADCGKSFTSLQCLSDVLLALGKPEHLQVNTNFTVNA